MVYNYFYCFGAFLLLKIINVLTHVASTHTISSVPPSHYKR
jgi:hypothetical protein